MVDTGENVTVMLQVPHETHNKETVRVFPHLHLVSMTLKAVAVCKAFEYCDRREPEIRSYFLSPLPKPRPYERTAYAARMTIRNTQSPIIALSPRSHFAATRETRTLVLVSPPRVLLRPDNTNNDRGREQVRTTPPLMPALLPP